MVTKSCLFCLCALQVNFIFCQVGDDGVQPPKLLHHDGHYDIPESIKPETEKMRVEVGYTYYCKYEFFMFSL